MKIKEITAAIEEFAPPALQEDYDNSGLLVGDPNAEATKTLLTLDITEAVIDEAIEKTCNLVIAHHPLIFSGIKRLTGKNYVERSVIKAIKNDIAIYAAHTNMDNVHEGVNKKISEKLNLKNTRILAPKENQLSKIYTFCPSEKADEVRAAMFSAGAGQIGDYSECSYNLDGLGTFKAGAGADPYVGEKGTLHKEPEVKIETIFPSYLQNKIVEALLKAHPYEEAAYDIIRLNNFWPQTGAGMIGETTEPMEEAAFLEFVKKQLNTRCIRHTKTLGKAVKKVAVCGGAGSFLLKEALRQQADVFITGDFKYHQFFDAENQIVIADVGHYESEQFTPEIFHEILTKKFTNFAVIFSEINTNPINYFT